MTRNRSQKTNNTLLEEENFLEQKKLRLTASAFRFLAFFVYDKIFVIPGISFFVLDKMLIIF